MDIFLTSIFLIVIVILLIYFISKANIDNLYLILKIIFKKDSIVYSLISLLFFPGTLIHELAHALMARILLLEVVRIRLIPQWKRNSITLGTVTYVKRGRLSGVIVGIAPIFGGITVLYLIARFHLFPSSDMKITILVGYLIVAISSTMFSSKQDLVDAVYAIPAFVFLFATLYFGMRYMHLEKSSTLFIPLNKYLSTITDMLIFALFCQAILLIVLYVVRKLLRR